MPLTHCPVLVLRVVNELIKVSQVGEEGFAVCVFERAPASGRPTDSRGCGEGSAGCCIHGR